MNNHCDVMIDTSQPQHAGGQQRAAIGGVLSLPDLKLPTGGRNSLHIRLLIDAMAKRARSSLWRGGQQPNAVPFFAGMHVRCRAQARLLPITGHRR